MHFVQLHRVKKLGEPEKKDVFEVFTNKAEMTVSAASGGVVWLIRSGGRSSEYSVAWRFEIDGITACMTPGFKYSVIGRKGQAFEPTLPLTPAAIDHLARCTGDFRHGLSMLDDAATAALEETVAHAGLRTVVRKVQEGKPNGRSNHRRG
jgi:hypothetical protein